jgi:hypothetical protein
MATALMEEEDVDMVVGRENVALEILCQGRTVG